ncbi:MAG: peptidoglycan-binding domain-containing protein [Bryobacteraceae bacterium]
MLTSWKFKNNARLQAAAKNMPPLKAPEQGDAVRLLQEALVSLGYSFAISHLGGGLDGIYGNETTLRVAQFQRKEGFVPDGVAGTETLHRLDSLFGGEGATTQGTAQSGSSAKFGGAMQPLSGGGTQGTAGGADYSGSSSLMGGTQDGPADALRVSAVMICPHGGAVIGVPIPNTDLISGAQSGHVAGCVMGNYMPGWEGVCFSVVWIGANYQEMVNGCPTVRRAGGGLCTDKFGTPTGPVIIRSG